MTTATLVGCHPVPTPIGTPSACAFVEPDQFGLCAQPRVVTRGGARRSCDAAVWVSVRTRWRAMPWSNSDQKDLLQRARFFVVKRATVSCDVCHKYGNSDWGAHSRSDAWPAHPDAIALPAGARRRAAPRRPGGGAGALYCVYLYVRPRYDTRGYAVRRSVLKLNLAF